MLCRCCWDTIAIIAAATVTVVAALSAPSSHHGLEVLAVVLKGLRVPCGAASATPPASLLILVSSVLETISYSSKYDNDVPRSATDRILIL